MKLPSMAAAASISATLLMISATPSLAFCGAVQETVTAHSVQGATNKANRAIDRKAKQLRRQYRKKLVLSPRETACVGGGVSIDANGNQITGKPRCTVTMPFCVNP